MHGHDQPQRPEDGKVLAIQRGKRVLLKLPTKVVQDKLMVNVAGFV